MITCFIGTYDNEKLSIGAAKSLIKNIDSTVKPNIVLINAGENIITNDIFDQVLNIRFLRWFGFTVAQKLSVENNINVYIDDDIRLLYKTDLSRYKKNQYYMPNNGYMIQIWDMLYTNPNTCKKLSVIRVNNKNSVPLCDNILKELIYNNKSQIIDNLWLHIDKGSEKMTPARQSLIDYVDK
jgi:hypothetical protein